mmetsp:Transcript_25817/g.42177  ORF Transcript_25817/g.42177 Transcript_25817/m.42177 type:complete len:554 (+) Transcript_25817:75-1736(+)
MASKGTAKTNRAAISAKRKRMGMGAADKTDADDGVAYDPQLLLVARDRVFIQVFEKQAGSLHASVSFDEFCACLELLEINNYDQDAAKKAFKEMDLEGDDELEFENFVHAVHGAYPKYNLCWIEIMTKKKYTHFGAMQVYSLDEIVSVLKNKASSFSDMMTALRCAANMAADPLVKKDAESKKIIIKLLPGLVQSLKHDNAFVVRVACLCIADIAKSKKGNLKSGVSRLLNCCWELFDHKAVLASYSASMLSKALLKYVPDDDENKVLKTLIQGTQLKDFDSVQRGCYDGIMVYLKKAGNPKAKSKPNKEFYQLIVKTIEDGLKSDDKATKERCYQCLALLEKANTKKAQLITQKFTVQQQSEFESVQNGGGIDDAGGDDAKEQEEDAKDAEERMPWEPDVSKRGPRELSRDYDERKEQLNESFDAYDDDGEGYMSTDRTQQFLRDLFEVTGQDADIAIKGLDAKMEGRVAKAKMMKWALLHSWNKVRKNPMLEQQGQQYGYKSSRKERLQERVDLFEKLKEIELAEHNYAALFDIDVRTCVLKYFIKQKQYK